MISSEDETEMKRNVLLNRQVILLRPLDWMSVQRQASGCAENQFVETAAADVFISSAIRENVLQDEEVLAKNSYA